MHSFEFPLERSKMQRWRKREIGGELAVIMEFPALLSFKSRQLVKPGILMKALPASCHYARPQRHQWAF